MTKPSSEPTAAPPAAPPCPKCGNATGNRLAAAARGATVNPVDAHVVVVCGACGARSTVSDPRFLRFVSDLSSRP